MKLSIIIPIYNVEKYLFECMDSLRNLPSDEVEVILINDGSTDNSEEIAKEFILNRPNFKLYSYENSGLSVARNRGLEHCVGEYIMFLDSDDILNESGVIKIMEEFSNKYDVIFYNGFSFFDEDDNTKPIKQYDKPAQLYDNIYTGKTAIEKMLDLNSYKVSACMYAIRRESLSNLKFYPGIYHEDNIFTTELLLNENVKRVTFKNIDVYKRRVRDGSITTIKPNQSHLDGYIFSFKFLINKSYNDNREINKYLVSLLAKVSETAYLMGNGIDKYINKPIIWAIIMKIKMFGISSYAKYSILILFPFLKYIRKKF